MFAVQLEVFSVKNELGDSASTDVNIIIHSWEQVFVLLSFV
jgi:hypothetical protein